MTQRRQMALEREVLVNREGGDRQDHHHALHDRKRHQPARHRPADQMVSADPAVEECQPPETEQRKGCTTVSAGR